MLPEETTVISATATLTVRDYGGDGAAVVLVHGLSSNLEIWHLVAPALARRFRVVAYDQRSHGLSTDGDGDFGFEALVTDLRAVVAATKLDRPVVVGHSWGASVALAHAATDPSCPGVVCVDGGVFDLQGMGSSWEQTEELLRPPKLIGPAEKVLARIRAEQSFIPWDRLEPVVVRARAATEDGLTRPRLRFEDHMTIVRRMWEQSLWDLYERVQCPAQLVLAQGVERNNREQGFVALKKLAVDLLLKRRPDITVEWLESVHDIPLASPNELARLIENFVARSP